MLLRLYLYFLDVLRIYGKTTRLVAYLISLYDSKSAGHYVGFL
jgi:hypothetical protein